MIALESNCVFVACKFADQSLVTVDCVALNFIRVLPAPNVIDSRLSSTPETCLCLSWLYSLGVIFDCQVFYTTYRYTLLLPTLTHIISSFDQFFLVY